MAAARSAARILRALPLRQPHLPSSASQLLAPALAQTLPQAQAGFRHVSTSVDVSDPHYAMLTHRLNVTEMVQGTCLEQNFSDDSGEDAAAVWAEAAANYAASHPDAGPASKAARATDSFNVAHGFGGPVRYGALAVSDLAQGSVEGEKGPLGTPLGSSNQRRRIQYAYESPIEDVL